MVFLLRWQNKGSEMCIGASREKLGDVSAYCSKFAYGVRGNGMQVPVFC
jgi:hypothetical protein